MKPKFYELLIRCIEGGASVGVSRAYKHDDEPSRDTIAECVVQAITDELFEWFDFETPTDE